jgi:cell division septum initiation protein DivIVA
VSEHFVEEVPAAPDAGDCAAILDELTTVVERAKSMPLSTSAIVSREEVLGLLNEARNSLPSEIRHARRLLTEREELRAQAARDAAELIDEARAQAAHMVQRTEVVRQARNQSERIIADAETEARRIRHDADDYVDRKLAAFEIVLDRTMRTVQSGRERLAVAVVSEHDEDAVEGIGGSRDDEGFFDQDER